MPLTFVGYCSAHLQLLNIKHVNPFRLALLVELDLAKVRCFKHCFEQQKSLTQTMYVAEKSAADETVPVVGRQKRAIFRSMGLT